MESALKLARQYHLCLDQPDRVNFIARQYSYHGNTLGALSAGFNPPRRKAFEPLLSSNFHHVSPCFYSRDGKQDEDESHYVQGLLDQYEDAFNSLGPQTVAAVILEPVGGATLGSVPAADGYLPGLKRLCEKHGALLIFDEVMCGMGRIGTLHAWQSLGGAAPGLQTIGKGLGAGYQPISGILVSPKVHKAIEAAQDSSPLISGHTYQGHSIGCAAALAVQQIIMDENLLENVQDMGARLEELLKATVPHLKEVRGRGLFMTVEFQSHPSGHLAPEVSSRCLQNGAAVYLCSSAVDAILFAPPFIITAEEVEQLVNIFVLSVNQVLVERGVKLE